MPSKPESKIQKDIVDAIKGAGGFAVKIHGGTFQSRGLPDVNACWEGVYFGLEVKVPGKEDTTTELQKKKLYDICAAGGVGHQVTSVEQALEVLRKGAKKVKNGKKWKPNVEPPEST